MWIRKCHVSELTEKIERLEHNIRDVRRASTLYIPTADATWFRYETMDCSRILWALFQHLGLTPHFLQATPGAMKFVKTRKGVHNLPRAKRRKGGKDRI